MLKSIFLLFFALFSQFIFTQSILVGQKEGADITYVNIDDVTINGNTFDGRNHAYLDIDSDGLDDLDFNADAVYYSHINYSMSDASLNAMGKTQLALHIDDTTCLHNMSEASVIDNDLSWSGSYATKVFLFKSSDGGYGNFNGEGYCAFRICDQDTIYGWIRVFVTASDMSSHLKVYEYAFYKSSLDIPESIQAMIKYHYDPITQKVHLNIPREWINSKSHFDIYNATGMRLFSRKLNQDKCVIDVSRFKEHFLIFHLQEIRGRSYSLKIITRAVM